LTGVISLRDLIIAQPKTVLGEIMRKRIITVEHHDEHDKVLEVVRKYGLLAVPVVDEEGVLLGIITVDNVIDMLLPDRGNLETFSNFILRKRSF
jgi:Mg/Co/Ni transporter MgtE